VNHSSVDLGSLIIGLAKRPGATCQDEPDQAIGLLYLSPMSSDPIISPRAYVNQNKEHKL
jgi:hypothetical protein